MSSEKRKASSAPDSQPRKKQQTTSAAKIQHVHSSDTLKPIIATTPGVVLPSTLKFRSFAKKTPTGPQLLLHSSDHPTIDYTAVEGDESTSSHLKHYVGIYDPKTSSLKLTEAKHLTVRGSIRQAPKQDDEEEDEDTTNFPANQATRSALTEAFGSKKSKKAVQAMADNRQLGQGVEGVTIAEAITAGLKEEDDEEDEVGGAAAASRNSKPLPQADLHTDDIEEVYSLAKLVVPGPASNTLKTMPIDYWRQRMRAGKEVPGLRSRFVANRITYIGKRVMEDSSAKWLRQMQLLRYVELLLEIAQFASKQDKRRRMSWVDDWPEGTLTSGVSPMVVKGIVKHYFPDNTPSERAMTLLRTSIFALMLHILPPSGTTGGRCLVAEPTDVQLDLAMEGGEVRKLYHELGCKVAPAVDRDLVAWGLTKMAKKKEKKKEKKREDGTKVPKPVFAVLKFPLDFPKMATGKRARK